MDDVAGQRLICNLRSGLRGFGQYLMYSLRYIQYLFVFMILFVPVQTLGQTHEELLLAAKAGDVKTVERLTDRGAGLNTSDDAGNTLLMIAAREGHANLVQFLLSRKASVGLVNRYGDSALMVACLAGKLGIVKSLLRNGAQLNPPGWSPLHYAAFENRADVVSYLLEQGADKNALAPNGYTALMLAARGGHVEAAKAILFEDPDVNVRGPQGETALAIATQRGLTQMAELLRRGGAVE